MNNLCSVITCLGILINLGLIIWILVKQRKCSCQKHNNNATATGGSICQQGPNCMIPCAQKYGWNNCLNCCNY